RRICAGSCELMPAITTRSERTGHWIRMRRSFARFSRPETSNHTQFLVHFITITSGPRFSVHTGAAAVALDEATALVSKLITNRDQAQRLIERLRKLCK